MKTGVLWLSLAVVLCVSGFALWWRGSKEPEASSLRLSPAGQAALALAESRGCLVCHSVDGTAGIGPGWVGSYGASRILQDGSSVVMDENYLRRSMRDPAAQVLQGFDNVMVPATLSDAEVDMLIGLFRELGTEKSP